MSADPNDYEPVANPNDFEVVTPPTTAPQSGIEAATAYGQEQGAPTITEQKQMVSDIPEAVRKPLEAAAETVSDFIPKTPEAVAKLAMTMTPVYPVYQTNKNLYDILTGKPPLEAATQGIPVAQRIPEIIAAEQTPPFSKERYKAGFGTLADLLMVGGIGKGIAEGARLTPKPGGLHETLTGQKPEFSPEVAAVNEGLSQLEKEIPDASTQPVATSVTQPEVRTPVGEAGTGARPASPKINNEGLLSDEQGKPVVMYHGTSREGAAKFGGVPVVEMDKQGRIATTGDTHTVWWTSDKEAAKAFGGNVVAAHLKIKNPADQITHFVSKLGDKDGAFSLRDDGVITAVIKDESQIHIVKSDTGSKPVTVPEAEAATTAANLPEKPQSITSIKNEQVDTERASRNLPPVVEPARKAFGETWEQATKKIDDDPTYPDRLISELKTKPRSLTDVEDASLLHRQVDLQNQFQKSADALFKARETGDEVGAMEHDARVNALSDQLLELYDVGKKAGTETGRGLAARRLLAAEDFSLANMVTQKRAANPTIDLETATKTAQEASSKISAAQTAYDAYETSPKAEAYRRRLKNLTEQYKRRTASGDFSRSKSEPILLDKEGQQLKANLERAKKEWLTGLQKDRAANRTPSQKFWDRFVGVERAMKLSSDVVLAKLSAAAAVREAGLTPAEEVVGAGIGKILPGLAKRAPREGGFSLDAEIKAKSEMFTSGMKDAWQNLKMKQTDLDTLYSSRKPPPPSEFYDYLGYLHGALKAPVKRSEFARSLTKRMRWAVENGQDLNNVNTMRGISEEAYVDANRSIFMQDNVVASTFTGALRMAEQSKKAPNLGPAVARIGRFLVPIVKIPTNIVGEVATGIHGVPVGGTRAAVAYLKGIDSLPPPQADSIMRQLKKGSVGGALILTGYYTADNIGGFYHDKDKRTKADVQPGRYRIGNVDLPASAGHSTGAMLLNIGATVKRVQDERINKSEPTKKGLGQGVLAAGSGLAHEIPFVPAATGITEAIGSKDGFQRYINSMIQSTTVPALSSHIAKILDTPGSLPSNLLQEPVKRKPTNPVEAVKMGVPGLRQTVPEREEKKKKNVGVLQRH